MYPCECSVEGCDRPSRARGLCHLHYQRWNLHGSTDARPKGRRPRPLVPDDPRHGAGTNAYTNYGCRCEPCKSAWAAAHLDYMHRTPEQQEKARQRTRAYNARRRAS